MVSNLKQKRGARGGAALYATRNQALAKLQLRLPDFRRLCILKGVHPREPKRKTAGQNKTYYHVKDIAFLAHEPLLAAFRAARAHRRKVRRAQAKGYATVMDMPPDVARPSISSGRPAPCFRNSGGVGVGGSTRHRLLPPAARAASDSAPVRGARAGRRLTC